MYYFSKSSLTNNVKRDIIIDSKGQENKIPYKSIITQKIKKVK